jgi:hypothetical protein
MAGMRAPTLQAGTHGPAGTTAFKIRVGETTTGPRRKRVEL